MMRWIAVSLVLAGCGGREVSKVRYTSTTCDDNCGIAPKDGDKFAPADDSHEVVLPNTTPDPKAKAPEPTCRLVGEVMASLEIGNYAEAAEREPKVAAAEKKCASVKTTREDRQCLVDSYDEASMAYCVPALFPSVKIEIVTAADCDSMVRAAESTLTGYDRKQWQPNLAILAASCKADRWNMQMLQCASTSQMAIYPQNCMYVQPPAIWKKVEARLTAKK